jgi:hypothetical protein
MYRISIYDGKWFGNIKAPIAPCTFAEFLAEWNAIDLPGTEYIEFKTEEDLSLFLLRWS